MMKISEIWVYPVKSLRGISLPAAKLTQLGIPKDRRFMLLKHEQQEQGKDPIYENMHVSKFPQMCLFTTSMQTVNGSEPKVVTVTYTNPDDASKCTLDIPFTPDTATLKSLNVTMHQSPTKASIMPEEYCSWFSDCFGFKVVLAYIGNNLRSVLGNLSPNVASKPTQQEQQHMSSWIPASLQNLLPAPLTSSNAKKIAGEYITFADCAPYLITSRTSLENVSSRLPEGMEADITKFRPNIVLDGANEAWDEDYWAALTMNDNSGVLQLTGNCVRCTSLNVDYLTGHFATGSNGQVLKKLQTDRRVDLGSKWSPVFGRYAFLDKTAEAGGEFEIHVGDEIRVSARNEARTRFCWPGLAAG